MCTKVPDEVACLFKVTKKSPFSVTLKGSERIKLPYVSATA